MSEWDWHEIFLGMAIGGTMALYAMAFPMVATDWQPEKYRSHRFAIVAYLCLGALPFIGMAGLVIRSAFGWQP
jgi:NO-binding membrane sensor protein with MHYT domain